MKSSTQIVIAKARVLNRKQILCISYSPFTFGVLSAHADENELSVSFAAWRALRVVGAVVERVEVDNAILDGLARFYESNIYGSNNRYLKEYLGIQENE